MTNYDAKISIHLKLSSQQLLDNYLKSIYLSLKTDNKDVVIPNITDNCKKSQLKNTDIDLKVKTRCLEINIQTDDISELRSYINSYLRLFSVAYGCMNTLQQNIDF